VSIDTLFGVHPEVLTAVAAVVTALIALAAAWYARGQVRESRLLREEQAQPFVIVDMEPSPHASSFIELVVANLGHTLARDVTFKFDPPLRRAYSRGVDPNEWSIFKDGIPSFPPGKMFRMLFDIGHERFNAGLHADKYAVTVEFKGPRGQYMEPLTYILDGRYYFDPNRLGVRTIHTVAQELEKVSRTLQGWQDRGTLGVTAYDGDKRREQETAEVEQFERARRAALEAGEPEPQPWDD
jgi:hypothetical protein